MASTTGSYKTFREDYLFLKQFQETIELITPGNTNARALVVPGFQGRVMTSTARGNDGYSYGWINYRLISSGINQPHMNAFGGEERFWLSPEGGQFSVYFAPGAPFDFENWQTPALIDSVAYPVTRHDRDSVAFGISASLRNHSGTDLFLDIERSVTMLDAATVLTRLGLNEITASTVAYETVNSLRNTGPDWGEETGLLGIWLLGMFKPSDQTVIIAPYSTEFSEKVLLTDDYFGKIPSDRLTVQPGVVLLRADGKYRSKIGIAPHSALNVAGSYDPVLNQLTLIQYSVNRDEKYLKSTWEQHANPYGGDVLNAYNDGPLEDGSQMGPFYELESNSYSKALSTGEVITHVQQTYHFEGSKPELAVIARQVLGVDLDGL